MEQWTWNVKFIEKAVNENHIALPWPAMLAKCKQILNVENLFCLWHIKENAENENMLLTTTTMTVLCCIEKLQLKIAERCNMSTVNVLALIETIYWKSVDSQNFWHLMDFYWKFQCWALLPCHVTWKLKWSLQFQFWI